MAKPPVVLLGGLNVVRALGLAGIPVIVASCEGRKPSMASRYCTGVWELPPIADREAVVDELIEKARTLGERVPLFYDNDDRLALVQDYRDALAPHFSFLLNEKGLAEDLLEKSRFQALAERTGLPVPRRIAWEELAEEEGPVLVKPKTRTAWDHSAIRLQLFGGAGKARVFAHGKQAMANPLVVQLADSLSFQEYVPGGDDAIWSYHGFAAPGGDVLASFVGRKIRTYPALTGDSSYLALAKDKMLEKLGRAIAARLGLAGVFKMDFKRHPDSGRYYLFEINTRFNLWHYLGAASGVNLAAVAYDYLLDGTRPFPAEARIGLRWLHFAYDRKAYRQLKSRGEITTAQWIWSLLQAPKVYDVWAWSDPWPLFVSLKKKLIEKADGALRNHRRHPRQPRSA